MFLRCVYNTDFDNLYARHCEGEARSNPVVRYAGLLRLTASNDDYDF